MIQPIILNKNKFEKSIEGKRTSLYTLKNRNGLICQITNFGGRVVSLWTPDQEGNFEDVVLGYDSIDRYIHSKKKYYGAIIGRYGNRIKDGKFTISNQNYQLTINSQPHHLHGGTNGLHYAVWDAKQIDDQHLELTYLSKDGEEGYPGNLKIRVLYSLTDSNELKIEYFANTDKAGPVNLTNHSYFNLCGAGNGNIKNHILKLNADYYLPVDESKIPTHLESVLNSPMDYTNSKRIGDVIDSDFDQLNSANGYDHNYVINKKENEVVCVAEVAERTSGRTMEVYSNQPGVQFYTNNSKNVDEHGKYNKTYGYQEALCLELQHFPDSPNQPNFPNTILTPDNEYYHICIYKFAVETVK